VQVGSRPVRLPGLLTTLVDSRRLRPEEPRRPGGCAASYAVEGTVNAAATALDWAGRHIHRRIRTADLDRVLGPYDPLAHRAVHFLPAVSGLGAPRWDERAQPKFVAERHARGGGATALDHLRAAVESIAQRCAEIARTATPSVPRTRPGDTPLAQKAVRVSGGLTRCLYLMRSQADLLQRPILVTSTTDATAIGAALMAAGEAGRTMMPHPGRGGAGDALIEPLASARRAAAMRRSWMAAVYGRPRAGRIGR
jgi:glycerol kinase